MYKPAAVATYVGASRSITWSILSDFFFFFSISLSTVIIRGAQTTQIYVEHGWSPRGSLDVHNVFREQSTTS